MGHHGARLHQRLQVSQPGGLPVDGLGGRRHDQPDIGGDGAALQHLGGGSQILQPAVGAAADEHLVHRRARHVPDGVHIVHPVGAGEIGGEGVRLIGQHPLVWGVLVEAEPVTVRQVHAAEGGGLFVRGEQGRLGPALHRHVGDGCPAGDAELTDGGAGELQGFVNGAGGGQVPQHPQDDVLGEDALGQGPVHHHLDGGGHPDPQLPAADDGGHLRIPHAGGEGAHGAVGGGVAVRAEDDPAGGGQMLFQGQLVADAVRHVEPLHAVLILEPAAVPEAPGIVVQAGGVQVVHHDGDPLRVKDPVKAHVPELLKDIGGVDVVEDRLVHPDRHHVAGAQVLRTGVVEQQLLRQGMAGAVGVPQSVPGGGSGQGGLVQRLHPGHQAAVAEDVQHLPAEGGDGIGGAIAGELPAHLHLHGVALPAAVIQVPALDQQQAVVDGVAEEDLGKALGDDAADARCL